MRYGVAHSGQDVDQTDEMLHRARALIAKELSVRDAVVRLMVGKSALAEALSLPIA